MADSIVNARLKHVPSQHLKYQNEHFDWRMECLKYGSLGKRVCMWSANWKHDYSICSLYMHKTMNVNCCVTSVNLYKKSWHLDPLIHPTKIVLWWICLLIVATDFCIRTSHPKKRYIKFLYFLDLLYFVKQNMLLLDGELMLPDLWPGPQFSEHFLCSKLTCDIVFPCPLWTYNLI